METASAGGPTLNLKGLSAIASLEMSEYSWDVGGVLYGGGDQDGTC